MSIDKLNVRDLDPKQFKQLKDGELQRIGAGVLKLAREDRRENQLMWYQPVSDGARDVHRSIAKYVGVGGGNRASKSDTVLAELSMHATGIYPIGLDDETAAILRSKFRGPVNIRVVVESLTTTLHPIILPKLKWWTWDGPPPHGGDRGHWGWIPKMSLINGSWDKSWSEKLRTLRVQCRDPDDPRIIMGESTFQFMAINQDPSDFASGNFHHCLHDELCTHAQWREDDARVMGVGGRMYLAMTWPDDPAIPVDWAYDELYEVGRAGPNKDPHVDWFELSSFENMNILQDEVALKSERWSDEVKRTRLLGQPIRFSNRVHPLFTDLYQHWCTECAKQAYMNEGGTCSTCGNESIVAYNHVIDFPTNAWPVIYLLDPHPRKPHMMLWAMIDPNDDIWVIAEALVDGEPDEVRAKVDEIERGLNLYVPMRLGDPNMLRSPAGPRRGVTWLDEFTDVGLFIDLADNSDVGRGRVNEFLQVDPFTHRPRLHVHPRCEVTNLQMKRYVWDDYKHHLDKDQKQKAKDKNDDMPSLLKYLMNYGPSFDMLRSGIGRKVKVR